MTKLERPTAGAVRARREEIGLTQKEAAKLVGMDVSNWERIEAGSRVMRARTFHLFLARIEDARRILRLEKEVEQYRHVLRLALDNHREVEGDELGVGPPPKWIQPLVEEISRGDIDLDKDQIQVALVTGAGIRQVVEQELQVFEREIELQVDDPAGAAILQERLQDLRTRLGLCQGTG